ncbi:hypothetical protein Cma02nite_12500 [Cellulomonas marina]|nr:hypothetical protein Cma02nite_12500 [Cellulomonas marina]
MLAFSAALAVDLALGIALDGGARRPGGLTDGLSYVYTATLLAFVCHLLMSVFIPGDGRRRWHWSSSAPAELVLLAAAVPISLV